jgi:Holliday junction resolvasome RuvABC endonuclease subunit
VNPVILALDQGINRTGYCVGAGDELPRAGAFRFEGIHPDDLGELAARYRIGVRSLIHEYRVSHVIYEAPFLARYRDRFIDVRRRAVIDGILEEMAYDMGLVCAEEPYGVVKRALAGFAGADKDDMVAAALKMGVELPKAKADGREDAADAVGVWLVGIQAWARRHQQQWDRVLYSGKRLV